MYSLSLRDPQVIGTLAASVACIGGVTAYLILRRRPSPDELERERRAQLVRTGRIIDGTILDISEASPQSAGDSALQGSASGRFVIPPSEDSRPQMNPGFILYKYEIGGVEYECSQDISALRDYVRPEDLRLSFPCSVRYDVHRPENSIVVAENWSGLRRREPSIRPRPSVHGRTPGMSDVLTTPGAQKEPRQ